MAGVETCSQDAKARLRERELLLCRMVPLVENNFNYCELGPRSTGKSHLNKEVSPNSILVSGGQTTVANLFYNMASKQIGLVGLWDCVAFDEVAGIHFKDHDGIQIMKDYMASGSFSRGKEEKSASASMVFVGNINQSVESLLKTSSLFAPLPSGNGGGHSLSGPYALLCAGLGNIQISARTFHRQLRLHHRLPGGGDAGASESGTGR